MEFQRRDFLKLGFTHAMAAAVAVPGVSHFEEGAFQTSRRNFPSILQGATDATRTQFSILHHEDVRFDVVVRDRSARTWMADKEEVITELGSPYRITKVYFSGLHLNELFYLDLLTDGGALMERREFATVDLQKKDLRFALCSCMDDRRHEAGIWQDLVDRRPDVIFFIGDAVYVDAEEFGVSKDNTSRLWRRFSEARRTLQIYYSKRLIPVIATWDDHDFGRDNSDSLSYPHVAKSQRNFLSYFAQTESHCENLVRGPGVSSALKAGAHLFILMDDRSYRLPAGSANRFAHWGSEQEKWALDLIAQHNGVTWLMNGSQMFPSMVFKESLSGEHPQQFNGFMDTLRTLNKKVIFASGDVHFSEISKIESAMLGYETYEVTSSSMHSKCLPGLQHIARNDRRLVSTAQRNYVLVDSQADGEKSEAHVYSCSTGGSVNFHRQLLV